MAHADSDSAQRSPTTAAAQIDAAFGDEPLSTASTRLRSLAVLSGSLTDALDPEDAAALVEQKALSALGATSAVVLTIGPFPPAIGQVADPQETDALTILHAIGLPREVQDTMERLAHDSSVPFGEVARSGQPLYLHNEDELRRYPAWGGAMIGAGAQAAAVVPVWANGELRGVLGLAWPGPCSFDEDERAFVVTLGIMCAQAIMRSHLRAAEKAARIVAESANRSKTQFLTMISHELRTPMNAVLGYAQLIADGVDGPVTETQQVHLQRVQTSGKHLLGLVEDLLGYARVEAGGDTVHLEDFMLAALVSETLDIVRPLADVKGMRIRLDDGHGPIELHTDARKLRQILVNLLGNAVKFTDSGDVVLLLRLGDQATEAIIYFDVTDTGPGISADDQVHVFDAYWQVDPKSSHGLAGSGLGLPVARQLARQLGGDVVISRSEMGFGSTFMVSIPLRYAGAA